ncbi:MAG: Fur family transcriptional regulator [Clostridiales bacterium]|jgi:Fur family ferric uptake transcriptional regulator|nr:transcriptional repressor [Eubacteriales bacterium]MDH7566371.1 Fur family transcriptional regulator [Clostridiales bacterium]
MKEGKDETGLQGTKDYKDLLKKENLRNTKHRNSILEVIEGNGQPITAEAVFLKLKEQGVEISLSTVYRVLEALVSKGIVLKSILADDNKALFEINRMEHRHHLLCVKCRNMISVDGCPLDDYEKALTEKLGFDIKGHKLEIYGYCRDCRQEEK